MGLRTRILNGKTFVENCHLPFIQLRTPNTCTYLYYLRSLKFTLKHLKRSYMFRSHDHPQGAYIVPC